MLELLGVVWEIWALLRTVMYDELCYNSCIDVYEAGNGREIRVHKVNR